MRSGRSCLSQLDPDICEVLLEFTHCWAGWHMDIGTRLPSGEGAGNAPFELVVFTRATWPPMREAFVEFPCSPQSFLDFPILSLGVHGEVKVGLGQSRFEGRYCLSLWPRGRSDAGPK